MSDVLKISGPLKVGSLAADPSNAVEGYIYFNTTSGVFRLYENGSFRDVSAEQLEAHLDGTASKHDATEIDYERTDGSKKNIQAASDDVESAVTDLDDAVGALDPTPTNYTATDPAIVADHLTGIDTALASIAGDAADVTYTPTTLTDWDADTDPGNVDGALDQLAERVDDNEIAIATKADSSTVTEIDANVDDLITLSGVAENSTNLGTFTGTTIADNTTVKPALQSLETEVETKPASTDVVLRDGSQAFTADQSMGSNKLTNLAAPTTDTDAANKAYVDAIKQGLDVKDSVRAASTANVALTGGATLSVDGVSLANGDRVLLKDQSTASQNGLYSVSGIGTAYTLTRTTDADEDSEVTAGLFTFVTEGSTQADSGWILTTDDPITVDTTALAFAQFSGAGQVTAGDGLSKSGNTLNVNVDGEGIEISGDELTLELDGSTLSKSASGLRVTAQTANRAMATDASGNITTSTTTDTELGHLSGVTSAVQTQLDSKLENVVEDTTPQLGGDLDVQSNAIESATSDVVLAGQDSVRRAKQASKSNFVEEEYLHSVALSASQTDTVIASLTFAHATFEGCEIVYKIKEDTSSDVRIGTIRVITNGTAVALNDVSTETADTGISFNAVVNGSDINIRYSSGANGATMRADIKRFLA